MNSQPNEIIAHILSYLDNYTLMFARGVCHKWKHLIETRIFYKTTIPALHVCILTNDYYHFGKYYLNYNYDTEKFHMGCHVNDAAYYNNLVMILDNKKIFRNVIRRDNLSISTNQLLIYASSQGHLEIIKYLISIGTDPHADRDYALQWSAGNGHLEVTQYLISIGADLHANHDCALTWSAENGHLEMVKYLISMGADLHVDNDYALRWSAYREHLKVTQYLISMGADLRANTDWIAQNCSLKVIEFIKTILGKN